MHSPVLSANLRMLRMVPAYVPFPEPTLPVSGCTAALAE